MATISKRATGWFVQIRRKGYESEYKTLPTKGAAVRRARERESRLDRGEEPIRLAEVLTTLDIPGKLTCPPFAITNLIYAERWDDVQSACEIDVISTACLLARWHRLTDPRAEADAVEDRILRRVIELRAGRGYIAALEAHRQQRFATAFARAANDAATLAPWLEQDAA